MDQFVRNLLTEWRRLGLPFKDETIIVGVSGGADSASLAAALHELRGRKKIDLRIVAAHFDHRLRADSLADLEFVRGLSKDLGLELVHHAWENPPQGNVEQSARNARYEFLVDTAIKLRASYILTAHTMNDQAETVLMNFIRGSGPDGLSGIPPVREVDAASRTEDEDPFLPFAVPAIKLARPLLTWATRHFTEGFCTAHKIDYRRDPMNDDLNFRRVWVRKVLIPMLEELNPKLIETLCRTSDVFRSGSRETEDRLPAVSGGELAISDLKERNKGEASLIIRQWVKAVRGDLRGINAKHIAAVEHLVNSNKSGRVAELPGGRVIKGGGRLKWSQNKVEK